MLRVSFTRIDQVQHIPAKAELQYPYEQVHVFSERKGLLICVKRAMGIKIGKAEQQKRQQHIDAWYGSGQSMRAAGLNYNSFKQWCYMWRKAHGIELADTRSDGHFIPVSVVNKPSSKAPLSQSAPSKGLYRFELRLLFGLIHFRIG